MSLFADFASASKGPAELAVEKSGGEWYSAPHLKMISDVISQCGQGKGVRAIISCPPRHGKSWLCSLWAPMWFLHRWPKKKVILASYAAEFAREWGRQVRDGFNEHHLGTMNDDVSAADAWNTQAGGGMRTAGVDGGITGKGANLLIIDDPVKNDEDARSPTIRERNWRWWLTTARKRLEPGADVVVIGTRWHSDDLIGRLLAQGVEEWIDLRFPALAEDDDPLGRAKGEALWPERYSRKELEKTRAIDGPYVWAALSQQRPIPEEGGSQLWPPEVLNETRVATLPEMMACAVGVDPSKGHKVTNDEQGIGAVGVDKHGSLYTFADHTVRLSPGGWGMAAVQAALRCRPVATIWVESNAGGEMCQHVIETAMEKAGVHGLRIESVDTRVGKHVRADPVSAFWSQGRGHMVGEYRDLFSTDGSSSKEIARAHWSEKLEAELENFYMDGYHGVRSPNRSDGMVWAALGLMKVAADAFDLPPSSARGLVIDDLDNPTLGG